MTDDTGDNITVLGYRLNPNAGWNGWTVSTQGVWYDALHSTTDSPTLGPEGSAASIWVKAGANIENLKEPLVDALPIILRVFNQLNLPHPLITSGNDSTAHSAGSKHYIDQAIDLRGNNITVSQGLEAATLLQSLLGYNYFVEFDTRHGADNNHIHIQSPPKQVGEVDDDTGIG